MQHNNDDIHLDEGFHASVINTGLSTKVQNLQLVKSFSISPNPCSGNVRIPLEVRLHKRGEIQIYSNTGVLIDSRSPLENNLVDISGLQSGIYYLLIVEPDNTGSVAKLIKI